MLGRTWIALGSIAVLGGLEVAAAGGAPSALGSPWVEVAKLLASHGAKGDSFGRSVTLSGETALIGARDDDDNGIDAGSADVLVRTGEAWTEQAKLLASDGSASDRFGFSVALSGDTALIGARDDDDQGTSSGSAYVFVRTGDAWIEQATE